jgi:hypothetical protein
MNSTLKFLIYVITIFFIFNIKNNSAMNYSNYMKNYYHIPSYDILEYSFKNEFFENVYKELQLINTDKNIQKVYKTKLDNIILYI